MVNSPASFLKHWKLALKGVESARDVNEARGRSGAFVGSIAETLQHLVTVTGETEGTTCPGRERVLHLRFETFPRRVHNDGIGTSGLQRRQA